MRKLFRILFSTRVCRFCGKERDDYDFYGDMCTECMGK